MSVCKWAPLTLARKERGRSSRLVSRDWQKIRRDIRTAGSKAVNTEKIQIKAPEGGLEKVKLLFGQNEEGLLRETQLTFGAAGLRKILLESE